jgi:hypothetical protein
VQVCAAKQINGLLPVKGQAVNIPPARGRAVRPEAAMTAVEQLNDVRGPHCGSGTEAGREPGDVELIAVSKTFDADAIRPVLDAGQRVFGENRVQEAQGKWPGLKEDFPDIELHLIGPLQSNKTKEAVALFDVIQTVDREKIARAIANGMEKQGKTCGSMSRSIPAWRIKRPASRRTIAPAFLTCAARSSASKSRG